VSFLLRSGLQLFQRGADFLVLRRCPAEYAKHQLDYYQRCADACRRCAEECRRMAA
jgi:hypothetical protein